MIELSEHLPGNISERIRDLRKEHNLTQEQLAEITGVGKSTISRIEKGDSVTDDIALTLAKYFGVSLDYLFGVTDDTEPVNYDLKSLGLSTAAAKKLYTGEVDADVVNLLIEHKLFGEFTRAISFYFSDVMAKAFAAQNTLYDEISNIVSLIQNENAEKCSADISMNKVPVYEMNITRIKAIFSEIIEDIKADFNHNQHKEEKETREIVSFLEKSVGKTNLALRRLNAERMANGVVMAICSRHTLSEEMKTNLVNAFVPLFANDISKR